MLWRHVPLIILPFLLLSPELCNCLFYPQEKKMYCAVVFLFRNFYTLVHTGLHSSYCWFPLYTPYFLKQDQEISSSRTIQKQKFAISIALKGVNLCDSKIAENAITQIPTTEQPMFYTATTDRVTPELWGKWESSKCFQWFRYYPTGIFFLVLFLFGLFWTWY